MSRQATAQRAKEQYADALTVLRALYARLDDEWDLHLEGSLRPDTEDAIGARERIRADVERKP